MTMEQVVHLKHKVISYPDLRKATDLPAEFFRETSALPNEDAMALTSQLFMMDKWPYVWTAVLIMKKHPTAMKKVRWDYLKPIVWD